MENCIGVSRNKLCRHKIYRKGSEYAYRIYELDNWDKFLCHTLIEKYQRVTNVRIEYINWVQGKKKFFNVTLIENIERVTSMRIEYMNRIQEKF